MANILKNIAQSEILNLKDCVAYADGLDGVGKITIAGKDFVLNAGESIVMPANTPHAVFGQENFKMLLVVTF